MIACDNIAKSQLYDFVSRYPGPEDLDELLLSPFIGEFAWGQHADQIVEKLVDITSNNVERCGDPLFFAKVLCVELLAVKCWICEQLVDCSEVLAFWKDLALRPTRVTILCAFGREFPDFIQLEDVMTRLIALLGRLELVIHRLACCKTDSDAEMVVVKAFCILREFSALVKVQGTPLEERNNLCKQVGVFRTNARGVIVNFVQEELSSRKLSPPPKYELYWPEYLACTGATLFCVHALITGTLHLWLEQVHLQRRSSTTRNTNMRTLDSDYGGGSMLDKLFSKQYIFGVFSMYKNKISKWINKKILNHVTSPTKNLINELIDYKEFEAKIEVFNTDDAQELEDCEMYLKELFSKHFADALPPGSIKCTGNLGGYSPTHISQEYEEVTRNPRKLVFSAGNQSFFRTILINFYFVKAEMLYVLKAVDFLLKGTNFNFELLATIPAVVTAAFFTRKLYSLIRYRSMKQHRSASMVVQRIRFIFRDIEQLLNLYNSSDENLIGRHVMLVFQLDQTLRECLWPNLDFREKRRFEGLLEELSDPFSEKNRQLQIIRRLWKCLDTL
mmetsp:Transcript_35513/g.56846  ORF Transcript_35513/g.56846 Transcript_35513/m.56846 type:complete len:560 (-) Transcript_35513:5477-7156(-)